MIYIYDLILNWNDTRVFNFFEWYDNDEIELIKKIPVFKISNFNDICDSAFKVSIDFLNRIFNKTEVYGNKRSEKVEYCSLFVDEDLTRAIAFEFNSEGECIYRSNIYIFDLDDVFNLVSRTNALKLDVDVLYHNNDKDYYLTRREKDKKRFLINEINHAYKNNNIDKLKYIYFELFEKECENIDFIRNMIVESLENNFEYNHDKIYNLIKIPKFL